MVSRDLRENGDDCAIYRQEGGGGGGAEKKIFVSRTSSNDPCNLFFMDVKFNGKR